MNWFKRFICNHEVDMEKLDVPVCKKCKSEIPRILDDATIFSLGPSRFWKNPILKDWYNKKAAKNMMEVFIVLGNKK